LGGSDASGLWVDLDWLLGLPLQGPGLSLLWEAVRDQLAADPAPSPQTETARTALEQALARQELFNLRRLCLEGAWFQGLGQLEALLERHEVAIASPAAPTLEDGDRPLMARVLAELILELHHRLIDDDAPPCPFDAEQRAELLWRAHELLGRLEPLPGPRPQRLPVVIEQVSRYGALAWMERQGPEARRRAVALLLRLGAVNPDALPWVLPAIRERLATEVSDLAVAVDSDDGQTLGLLVRWIEGLATLDPPPDAAGEALSQALDRARLSLDLLRDLER